MSHEMNRERVTLHSCHGMTPNMDPARIGPYHDAVQTLPTEQIVASDAMQPTEHLGESEGGLEGYSLTVPSIVKVSHK
jgi:hypothetical protein